MDFSKVKKLVIPEGEVQSITIADKVVWTKPQDKKWNTIVNKTRIYTEFTSGGGSKSGTLGTADLTKSKLFRFTINGDSATIYYGTDKITSTTASTGTYEISLDAEGSIGDGTSKSSQDLWISSISDDDYSFYGGMSIYINKYGKIGYSWYGNRSYRYNIGTTITVEQFY